MLALRGQASQELTETIVRAEYEYETSNKQNVIQFHLKTVSNIMTIINKINEIYLFIQPALNKNIDWFGQKNSDELSVVDGKGPFVRTVHLAIFHLGCSSKSRPLLMPSPRPFLCLPAISPLRGRPSSPLPEQSRNHSNPDLTKFKPETNGASHQTDYYQFMFWGSLALSIGYAYMSSISIRKIMQDTFGLNKGKRTTSVSTPSSAPFRGGSESGRFSPEPDLRGEGVRRSAWRQAQL